MIIKQDCADPICLFCKETIADREIAFEISKGRVNYYSDPKYIVRQFHWKEKSSDSEVYSAVIFHEHCFLEIAGGEFQFDAGTAEDPLII